MPSPTLDRDAQARHVAGRLHDGVAQDLAYVVALARSLATRLGDPELDQLADVAARGLGELRAVMTELRAGVQ